MYAIFNEACTFILLFLLEELLKSLRGLAFTLLCKLIRKWFFFFFFVRESQTPKLLCGRRTSTKWFRTAGRSREARDIFFLIKKNTYSISHAVHGLAVGHDLATEQQQILCVCYQSRFLYKKLLHEYFISHLIEF